MSNPFKLISSDPSEYNSMALKSNLLIILVKHIRDKGWTQSSAAHFLEVTQPRVSNLMNGKTDKFSIDTLLGMLFKLGYSLDMRFNPINKNNPLEMKVTMNEPSVNKKKGVTPIDVTPLAEV